MKYWRIYHYINSNLRVFRGAYLEAGADHGLNIRKVEAREKYGVSEHRIPPPWLTYQYQMKTGDFCQLIAGDFAGKFRVIFLREYDNGNLEERIKALHPALMPDGILIIDNYDPAGKRNEAWRVAVGLKAKGVPCGTLKDKYLVIFNPDGTELTGRLGSRMKKENYLKRAEKLVNVL